MKTKKISKVFQAQSDLIGFYGATIKEGTLLYPYKPDEVKPAYDKGSWHYRYVFDTTPWDIPKANNIPEGNVRISVWFNKKKWQSDIKPLGPEEIQMELHCLALAKQMKSMGLDIEKDSTNIGSGVSDDVYTSKIYGHGYFTTWNDEDGFISDQEFEEF